MGQFLIHAEHVTDFASAYADITGRHIGIGTDMAIESSMKAWQKRITSALLLPRGEKSEPPLPPPIGRVVREF